jgi:hypothetical protein
MPAESRRNRIPADILDDRRLDAFGGLIQHQKFRLRNQGPPNSQLLLLAAAQITARPVLHFLQHREKLKHMLGNKPLIALEGYKARLEILPHCQPWKYLTALRHIGNAGAQALAGLFSK